MVDVGLYAINPYQFRIAHDLNLDNFASPTEELPSTEITDNGFQSPNNPSFSTFGCNKKDSQQRNGFHSPDLVASQNAKNNYKKKDFVQIESGVFTLTLDRRPEKRERARSGSDVISPEPKRIGPFDNDIIYDEEDDDEGSRLSCIVNYDSCSEISDTTPVNASLDSEELNEKLKSPQRNSSVESLDESKPSTSTAGESTPTATVPDIRRSSNVLYTEIVYSGDAPNETCEYESEEKAKNVHHSTQEKGTTKNQTEESSDHQEQTVVLRRRRRPRKLPQIPRNARPKSIASLIRANSLADELSDADPGMRKAQRALKSKSWVETTTNSSNSSQDSGGLSMGYQSLEDLGSPEGIDPPHLDLMQKSIIEQDIMSTSMDASSLADCQTSVVSNPSNAGTPAATISHSMSMSLRDELESEGVKINNDLGSAFCDYSEYIDDEMPKLKKYFGGEEMRNRCNSTGDYNRNLSICDSSTQAGEYFTDDNHTGNYMSSNGKNRNNELAITGGSSRHTSTSSMCSLDIEALDATHRGCHKLVPRHDDEMFIEIGDLIFVETEAEDLWCEGVNLRTGQQGIFPAAYATDLSLLEDNDGTRKFKLRFLGSVEVGQHKGDDVICTAIQRVVKTRKTAEKNKSAPLYCLEINEYGLKMLDLTNRKNKRNSPKRSSIRERLAKILNKEIKVERDNDHFFALKNVSFCGYHPKNNKYFAFITKHPMDMRFACHVFQGQRTSVPICEAVGDAFKKFYQEYMAFTHPTEDIYIE